MIKQHLERFISKYTLGGEIEKAILHSTDTSISTNFANDGKDLNGGITLTPSFLPVGVYNIYETSKLRGLLAVLDDTIDVTLSEVNGKLSAMHFKDTSTKSTFALADKEAITVVSVPKKIPKFDISIVLNKKFIDAFIKSRGAIDADTFVVMNDGTGTQVILGYEKFNSTRIALTPDVEFTGVLDPMHFYSTLMKDIFMANKEATTGTMKISAAGLCHISFTIPNFAVDYYLMKVTK